jgi:hypothetical protein
VQAFSKKYLNYFFWLGCCKCADNYGHLHMIDEKKLKTVKNYADKQGFHRNWIYQLINKGKLDTVKIDGVLFIKVK